MKGLLRKDLFMILKYGRTLLIMCVIFLAMSIVAEENFFFIVYPVLLGGVLPVTLLSYDERFGWNCYCDALPITRKQVVDERYLMSLLSFLALYVLTLLVQAIVLLPKGRSEDLLELAGLLPCLGLIAPALMLPITLRWGVEKGRIIYYFIIGLIVAAGLIFANDFAGPGRAIGRWGAAAVLLVSVIFFAGSWLLSVKLYEKREL